MIKRIERYNDDGDILEIETIKKDNNGNIISKELSKNIIFYGFSNN